MESGDKTPQKSAHSLQIYFMRIDSKISHRFARTLITSKVRNLQKQADETTFSVIIPENAFIAEFEIEIKGKVYKSYVKEKQEAKAIYQEAVLKGRGAAHVALSARDSNTFTVSVNIEPESETIFRLTYEELLQRYNGKYELILNIHPGQLVEDLGVEAQIMESRPLTFVKTPCLRSGNEIREEDEKLNPSAEINIITNNCAIIKFNPNFDQQRKLGEYLRGNGDGGFNGQFVVQYDVERDPQGGEILVHDGYFVHFFAPLELEPLPKHIVFVLDHSDSMRGRKINQLVQAMQKILSELNPQDLFNIVRFTSELFIWNPEKNSFDFVKSHLQNIDANIDLYNAVEANNENIQKAKIAIEDISRLGSTDIFLGLKAGLLLIKKTQEKIPGKYQPMIILLTDGYSNNGITSTNEITKAVIKINSGTDRAAIFSLSLGEHADKKFLKKLSSENLGFSKHIYEAADTSLQLRDFYKTISSPLLNNIRFKYVDDVADLTETDYPLLFQGSELIVTGRTDQNTDILLGVDGKSARGPVTFNSNQKKSDISLERLWAYLTIKQLLKQKEATTDGTELTKKAVHLSLKYSLVTPVSSLVVVKSDEKGTTELQNTVTEARRLGGRRYRKRAISKKIDFWNDTDEHTFYEKFRLTKETCKKIVSQIEVDLVKLCNTITPMDQLLIALKFYASNGNLLDATDYMQLHVSTGLDIINLVSEILIQLKPRCIEMPKGEEIQKSQEKFYQLGGFPKVMGVIGAIHIRIRPGDDVETYRNQKGYFSVKCQIICDADLKILDIFLQPGAQKDATVFNNSQIKTRFEKGEFPNCVLLGNDGYPTGNYLLTSVKEPTTSTQQRYNNSHAKTLNTIENFFDSWIKRFPVLAYGSDIPLDIMENVIMATAVLHNLSLNLDETEPPPTEGIIQNDLEVKQREGQIPEIHKNDQDAEDFVNQIVKDYFS